MKNCLVCGKETNNKKFCSCECSFKYNNKILGEKRRIKNEIEYYKKGKKCEFCLKPIHYDNRNNRFCNSSCFASHNNKGVRRIGKEPSNCPNCGKRMISSHQIYCSKKCCFIHKRAEYIKRWENGEESGINKSQQISKYIRDYLFEKFSSKCEKCGWSKKNIWTKLVPLTVYHKNGNWEDNSSENIELLCPNCHSLTQTYGGRNKGKGRSKRYKD